MTDFESARLVTEIVVGLLTAFGGVLWWIVRKLVADVREGEKELSAYKLHASETYSTKNDLAKAFEQIGEAIKAVFAKLERIDDKLDMKADK